MAQRRDDASEGENGGKPARTDATRQGRQTWMPSRERRQDGVRSDGNEGCDQRADRIGRGDLYAGHREDEAASQPDKERPYRGDEREHGEERPTHDVILLILLTLLRES